MDLSGKVALVTGASQNIGRAIAIELAASGADVLINDVEGQLKKGEQVCEEVRRLDRKGMAFAADVSVLEQVQEMVQKGIEYFGHIDILVNNAAIRPSRPFLEIEPEHWNAVLGVILTGTYHCCFALIPYMLRSGWGRIINVVGITAFTGGDRRAHVVAAKAGVHGLTRALAVEFASKNIAVNSVVLGYIDTERDMQNYPNWPSEGDWKRIIPMGKLGGVKEVAKVVAFLVSDDSSYITGQAIHINGGCFIS